MFKKKLMACLTAAAVSFSMLAATVLANETSVDWGKGTIRATGTGTAKEGTTSPGIARAQARRAATMDAQRGLAERIAGVQVDAESTMEDLMLKSDIVRTRVSALIKGMTEVEAHQFDDGTYEVTLEMPMYGSSQALATAAFLPYKDQQKVPFPQPTNSQVKMDADSAVGGAFDNQYTGLIVECGGMHLKPVMSPVIRNGNGQSIYGHENLDIDKVIELGMASYADTPYDSISAERAGKNPLVVKAVKLDGFNSNPVLSVNDADKVLIANQADQFLDNCAVVFVK